MEISIPPRKPSLKSKNLDTHPSGFLFSFQKQSFVCFLKFTNFSTVHDRWRKQIASTWNYCSSDLGKLCYLTKKRLNFSKTPPTASRSSTSTFHHCLVSCHKCNLNKTSEDLCFCSSQNTLKYSSSLLVSFKIYSLLLILKCCRFWIMKMGNRWSRL